MYIGKRVKLDKIHYQIRKLDSYDKKYNFVVAPRCLGKSVSLWRKAYKMFRKTGMAVLVLRRYEADITETYLGEAEDSINKFMPEKKRVQFEYTKGTKDGFLDIYIKDKRFARIIALNTKESRLKSSSCLTGMMIFDEFICNNLTESYLKDEYNKLKSVYTTYSRAYVEYMETTFHKCVPYEKIYFCGNPYSIFNPYWAGLIDVDFADIKAGCFLVGRNYVIDCPPISEELKDFLIKHGIYDPLEDDEYTKYAFGGQAVNDDHIRVENRQPEGYTLKYVFRIQRRYIGMFKDTRDRETIGYDAGRFWCREMKQTELGNRKVLATDFDNLVSGTRLLNTDQRALLYILSQAISKRDISFQTIAVGYLTEEIYKCIK